MQEALLASSSSCSQNLTLSPHSLKQVRLGVQNPKAQQERVSLGTGLWPGSSSNPEHSQGCLKRSLRVQGPK